MAKVEFKNIQNVSRQIQNKLTSAINGSGVLDEIAEKVIEDIKEGKTTSDSRKKFAPLAEKTIKRRRRLATRNATDSEYSAGKSNLTFTGQLVNSIKAKIVKSRGTIVIEPTGTRKPYRGIVKRKLKQSITSNKKLAEFHAEGGPNLPKREIMQFSQNKMNQILALIRKTLRTRFRQ